jgi:hypothetical protein
MFVKQLSVFLENREGRVLEVFNILKNADINVCSVSLADTSQYGILRLLVNDVDKAQLVLKDHGISSKTTEVIAVNIPHVVGSLEGVLNAISSAGINISYMYGLSLGGTGASIAIKVNDTEGAKKALEPLGITFYTDEDLKNL